MAMELKMLTLASLLAVVLAFVGAAALILQRGLRYGFGNRDHPEPLSPWGERALRAPWPALCIGFRSEVASARMISTL